MKKIFFILATFILLISSLVPSVATAQNTIQVIDSSASVFFPSALTFNIEAENAVPITKIRLHYYSDRLNYAHVISEAWPVFTPNQKVKTDWIWDMRRSSLPVGATIRYWWTIEDANGNKLVTPENSIQFDDSRFQWKKLSENGILLFWYKGDDAFAKELMDAAQKGLERLSKDTGATLKTTAKLYIYGSTEDLQSAMLFPRGWEGGFAAYEYGTINIGISTQEIAWGKKAIAHELGHLVTHQITFSPYGDLLPVWLDEGLAMHAEGQIDPSDRKLIDRAISMNALISLRSLASPFSTDASKAALSYAQSQSVVEFLISTYGREQMAKLLHLFYEGSTIDDALQKIYGVDQDGLNTIWLASISSPATITRAPDQGAQVMTEMPLYQSEDMQGYRQNPTYRLYRH
ncbi:MAG TPA: peptidase MA domain-containing protein [Dehalococcoidia bacterium]|nr:peptidase MA domain-containing protein [Dehalococcoidia bacterium]